MVLITLFFVATIQERLDYWFGTLEKGSFVKMFSGKEVLRRPWNGAALPKCNFLRKRFCKGNCWRQV
jgi:hypothetical protein